METHQEKLLEAIASRKGFRCGRDITYCVDGVLYSGQIGHMGNIHKIGKASLLKLLVFKAAKLAA